MNMETRTLAPSFLKLLILPDFNSTISVPPFFSRSYEESLRGGKVTLRFGGTEKTWEVKVEIAEEDGRYEFTHGWDLFAHDVELRLGDIVVCKLVGKSTFHVSTFGIHCVEWKAAPFRDRVCYEEEHDDTSISVIRMDNNNKKKKGKAPIEDQQQAKSFTTVINTHQKYCLNIPMGFAKETGIMSGRIIKLQTERGKTWRVLVSKRRNDGRMGLMNEDWRVFWKKNNLSKGTKLTFTFHSSKPDTLVVTKNNRQARRFLRATPPEYS